MPTTKSPGKSTRRSASATKVNATATLQARLDPESKQVIAEAARLRRLGLTDYVRSVLVPAARKEVEQAKNNVVQLTADEQMQLWDALQSPPRLTAAQKHLGELMRGEA